MASPFRDAWNVLKFGPPVQGGDEQNFPNPQDPWAGLNITDKQYIPPDMQPQGQPPMDQPNNPFGFPGLNTDIDAQIQDLEAQIQDLEGQLRFLRMQRDGPYGTANPSQDEVWTSDPHNW